MKISRNIYSSIRKKLSGAESVDSYKKNILAIILLFFFQHTPFFTKAQGIIPKVVPDWQVWTEWKEPHSFGFRYFGNNKTHFGADVKAYEGAPVYSFAEGEVVEIFKDGDYKLLGNGILIRYKGLGRNGANLYALFAHLAKTEKLKSGDKVVYQQLLGTVGKTGLSYANAKPHLHLELRYFSDIFSPENPASVMVDGDWSQSTWADLNYEDPAEFYLLNDLIEALPMADIIKCKVNTPGLDILTVKSFALVQKKKKNSNHSPSFNLSHWDK